ncbi:MAG: hypothetical protein HC904_16630, partial [Blastochloris sp.]|nr:hypothetical protein [Blastochloris sp.]
MYHSRLPDYPTANGEKWFALNLVPAIQGKNENGIIEKSLRPWDHAIQGIEVRLKRGGSWKTIPSDEVNIVKPEGHDWPWLELIKSDLNQQDWRSRFKAITNAATPQKINLIKGSKDADWSSEAIIADLSSMHAPIPHG